MPSGGDAAARPAGAARLARRLRVAGITLPFLLIATGEQWVASSLTAILIAVPLTVALLALVGVDIAGKPLELLGAGCILLAPLAARSWPAAVPSGKVVLALVVLGLACSTLAMALFFFLIAEAGPSRATVITYLNPAVVVTLGVTLLGEHVGAGAVAGLLLILAGSWLSTGGRIPPGLPARLRPSRRAAAPARRAAGSRARPRGVPRHPFSSPKMRWVDDRGEHGHEQSPAGSPPRQPTLSARRP